MVDLFAAHSHSINHRDSLLRSNRCGCFHCEAIFSPEEITGWVGDRKGTALCPRCGMDAVLGDSSGFPVTACFLNRMAAKWFGAPAKPLPDALWMEQYPKELKTLLENFWKYSQDALTREEFSVLLEALPETLGDTIPCPSGWLRKLHFRELFGEEYDLILKVLQSADPEAKAAILAFFRFQPALTPERIYLLTGCRAEECPDFLGLLISPLYAYLLGKAPSIIIRENLASAIDGWQNHPRKEMLEENYLPELQLVAELAGAARDTDFDNPDSEAAFKDNVLSALKIYVRKPHNRKEFMILG